MTRLGRGLAVAVSAALCAVLALAAATDSAAQDAWTQPINLSTSGSASSPVIAATANGVLHVLWWDAFDGALHQAVDLKSSRPLPTPVVVPFIAGQRAVNPQTGQTTALSAPRGLRLAAGAGGAVHALWQTASGHLMASAYDGAQWGQPVTLTQSVLALDVATDTAGGVSIAYVRAGAPAGVYAQVYRGGAWSEPSAVALSPYYRTVKPEAMHTSIARQANGQLALVWDDPLLEQSVYAFSTDNGATWSAQQPVVGRQNQRVQRARVAAAGNGQLLLIWQDAASGGCGLTQQSSTDGGKTWGAAERVMTSLARCPATWRFNMDANGRLWLLGLPAGDAETPVQVGVAAAWNGSAWSQPFEVSVAFQNPVARRTTTLSNLSMAVSGAVMGVAGSDDKGDVWLTFNAVALDQLAPALQPVWSAPQPLSDGAGDAEAPAVAAGSDGRAYAMWSQQLATAGGEALYVAAWDGQRWGVAMPVFSTTTNIVLLEPDTQLRAAQPALAVDARGRLHAVWSGGVSGRILYSWVFGREAASTAWAYPEELPALAEGYRRVRLDMDAYGGRLLAVGVLDLPR